MSDRNPTTAPPNLVPVSAALGEEAGGEHHSPLWTTVEAPLLSLIMVQLLSLEEEKAEQGPEGWFFNQESRYWIQDQISCRRDQDSNLMLRFKIKPAMMDGLVPAARAITEPVNQQHLTQL